MASKITSENGIEITRQREGQLHPDFVRAWDKRAATLSTLVSGHNEFMDRLAAVEEAVSLRPFD